MLLSGSALPNVFKFGPSIAELFLAPLHFLRCIRCSVAPSSLRWIPTILILSTIGRKNYPQDVFIIL